MNMSQTARPQSGDAAADDILARIERLPLSSWQIRTPARRRRRTGIASRTWERSSGLGDVFLVFALVVLSAGLTVVLFATETKVRVLEEISP
jgi:hypothetical protein